MEQVPAGYDEDAIAPLLNGARAVIRSSLSTRTHVQYQSGARQLVAFLRKYAPTRILPLEEIDYILFTIFLLDEQELAPSSILQYYVHLNYFFEARGYPAPDFDSWRTFRRIRRELNRQAKARQARPKVKPLTWDILRRVIADLEPNNCDDTAFGSLLLVGVAGFFRCGELTVEKLTGYDESKLIRRGHIALMSVEPHHTNYLRIWLPKCKIDPKGGGTPVLIARNPEVEYCPVTWLLRHLVTIQNDTDPIWVWPSSGHLITRDTFIRKLRFHLDRIGEDGSEFAGHSMRRGAAFSARRAGLPDSMIKILGRWNSDCFRQYLTWLPKDIRDLNRRLALLQKASSVYA